MGNIWMIEKMQNSCYVTQSHQTDLYDVLVMWLNQHFQVNQSNSAEGLSCSYTSSRSSVMSLLDRPRAFSPSLTARKHWYGVLEKASLGRMDKIFGEILGIVTPGEFPPQALQLCLDRMFNVLAEKTHLKNLQTCLPMASGSRPVWCSKGVVHMDVTKEWGCSPWSALPKCSLQFVS